MIALRDELDAALPLLPPSSVDIDRVITRGRRGIQLRFAAGIAGTTGLVVGLVLLSAFVGPGAGPGQVVGGHRPSSAAGPGGNGSPSHSDGPLPTSDPAPPKVEGRPDIDRLNTLLLGAFQRAAPEFPTIISYQGQPEDPNVSCAPGEPQTSPGSCGTPLPVKYELSFAMQKASQYSAVFVDVGTAATMRVQCLTDTPGQGSPNPECHATTVNGMTVLDMSSDVQGNTSAISYALLAVHPDGTVVEIFVNPPVIGATPFMTKQQAIKVVVDLAVTLHP